MEYSRALHCGHPPHRVSWKSPFGLVRVNVAYPFLKQSLDKGQILNFNFDLIFRRFRRCVIPHPSWVSPRSARSRLRPEPRADGGDGSRSGCCSWRAGAANRRRGRHAARVGRIAAGRSIQTQLEGERRKIRDQVSKLDEELKTGENELRRQRSVMSPPSQNHCETRHYLPLPSGALAALELD